MSITYNVAPIVRQGLVLHLDAANVKSYPGSGITWYDISGNGNNGTLTNGPIYDSGNRGRILFDGVNDAVTCTDAASLNMTNYVTLSAWFNFSALPSAELGIFRKSSQWQLGLSNATTIRCLVGTNGTNGWVGTNDIAYSFITGNWYNMVMTYDGATMTIYVNNTIVKTAVVTGTIVTTANILQVGYHAAFLNGNIAHGQIYNRALSATEIAQNFAALRGRYGI